MTAPRITRTGPDHWQGTRPQTDAQRRHMFGPVEPMARPEGELSLWAGTMLVAAVCALAGLFAVMV